MNNVTKAVSWLISNWLEDDRVKYTEQLAILAERQVRYLMKEGSGIDLPELGWYEVEELIDILYENDDC